MPNAQRKPQRAAYSAQPNTRARIDARRKHARSARAAARPGPRRATLDWLASGRVAALVLLVASLGGLAYCFTAPMFAVQDVQISGTQILDQNIVAKLADVQGRSIWFVDTNTIRSQIAANPYVEQVNVYATLPNTVAIDVHERSPEVRWQVGATRYLVAADGLVLGTDTTVPVTDTLVIEDRSNRLLEPNQRVDADALKLAQLLRLRLPNEAGVQPIGISWDQGAGLAVTLDGNRNVAFGTSERIDEKIHVLTMLIHDGTAFTSLDLRPSTPFYRNDGGATPTQEPQP